MSNLVKRLRDWEHVHPEDYNKPEGHLYEEAADRIEELQSRLRWVITERDDTFVRMLWRVETAEAKLVRYNEVVGDKINLRAEIAELKSENKLHRAVVAEAWEEGRRAGLEEAAKVADDHSAMIVTGKIRALIDPAQTSTPPRDGV